MLTFPRPPSSAREDEFDSLTQTGASDEVRLSTASPSAAFDRDPLLVTKVQLPPAPHDLICRPQVTDSLEPSTGQQITIVSAPTGFGKTTALREWATSSVRPVAWLSIDARDNEPTRFWSYVIAAIETQRPGFGTQTASLLRHPEPATLNYVITTIINEIAGHPECMSIVLDDYHAISNDTIHESMRFLLEHLPPNLHLSIAGRSDPPFGLPRLRAQGLLIELRRPELRFQTSEATAFLIDAMGLDLRHADVVQLEQRTEGWVAGLRLAGIALRQHDDPAAFICGFNGQHRSIGDYLAEDVIGHQPEVIQQFMIETSILDRLSGPLCDAVTGREDSQAILETLENDNAFLIPLDNQRRWYRYQGLFADVLRDRLTRSGADTCATVHRRAARWYLDERLTREAVVHAHAGGDLQLVAEIIEQRSCPMLANGELDAISTWIALLPRSMVETRPVLGCLLAWVLVLTGRVDEADPLLDTVERSAVARGMTESRGEIAAIRAYAARLRQDIPLAIELSRTARELTPISAYSLRRAIALNYGIALWWRWEADDAELAFQESAELAEIGGEHASAVVALCHRAKLRFDRGHIDQSWTMFQEAVALADRLGVSALPSQSFVYLGMAYVLYERDELDEAERCLHHAIELGTAGGKIDHVILSYLEMTRIHLARGNTDDAREVVGRARSTLNRHPVLHVQAEFDLCQVMLWIVEGDHVAAEQWANDALNRVEGRVELLQEPERMAIVHVHLAQGRGADAWSSLQSLHDRSAATRSNGWHTCRIYTLIQLARIHHLNGDLQAARNTLSEAIQMAEPLGHVRTFADHHQIWEALPQLIASSLGVSATYIQRLLLATGMAEQPTPTRLSTIDAPSSLSHRELEVLRHVQDGLSNREIAETLFVTVGTVKRHTNSIYSKLDVGSRTQALARARSLNLFET